MKTEYKNICFEEKGSVSSRKTKLFLIKNKNSNDSLGVIAWYAPWRQYCFSPPTHADLVFSVSCLADIQDFINTLMFERRNKKEEKDGNQWEVKENETIG